MLCTAFSRTCRRMSCCFCLCRHPFIWYLLKDSHHLTQCEPLFRSREAFRILKAVALELTYGLWQSSEMYFDYPRDKTEMTTGAVVWHMMGSSSASTRPTGLPMPAWCSCPVRVLIIWLGRSMATCRELLRAFRLLRQVYVKMHSTK